MAAVVPRPEVELAQLFEGVRGEGACPVARPVETPIVEADQVPVAGEPDVAFHPVDAGFKRAAVCRERVLG
jgi:hypothetical protein